MQFQIYRTDASSYQDSKFLSNEKKILEEIDGVKYIQSLKEFEPGSKLILITNTHTDPKMIPQRILDETMLLIHPNSGFDNLTESFRNSVQFPIVVGNPIRANAVAEYTLSALFKSFSPIPNHHHWHEERSFPRKLLRDQKVLLLGHGNIGKILAQSLYPLCPHLQVFDPEMTEQHIPYPILTRWNDQILKDQNVVLFAASLNSSSMHLINESNMNQLSNDCLFINPARGELIEEQALFSFLNKNHRSYAYLDVFKQEPFDPGFAQNLKNINKTSHIAGMYDRLKSDIISFELLVIKDFINRFQKDNLEEFKAEYSECILIQP